MNRRWLGPALALLAFQARPAAAHVFDITEVLVVLDMRGTYNVDVILDADALALGVSPETDSAQIVEELLALSPAQFEAAVERARDTVLRRVRVRFDGAPQRPLVTFPDMDTPFTEEAEIPTVLGTLARMTGRVPEGATELTLGLSRAFGPTQITVLEQATLRGERYTLGTGEESPVYLLGQAPAGAQQQVLPPARSTGLQYLILGFEHIVPLGLDHVLFVLGLFLLSPRLRPLLWQVTAFTLAHTVSLGLSMAGIVSLPSYIVEPLIALSIVYVAVENLWTSELKPWRPALVFGFGLLHGLGFAGALRALGLPEGEFVLGLLAFNLGVELGQLFVIGVALVLVGWLCNRAWYRTWIVHPLSIAIAAVALFWTVQRVV